jgi:fatty acid desaturase
MPYPVARAGTRVAEASPCLVRATQETRQGKGTPVDDVPPPEVVMIILGVILLVVGLVAGIGILWTIGIVLVAIGVLLWILGAVGHEIGGRRHYY